MILSVLLVSCDMHKYPEPEGSDRREILIYSGITMVQPLLEIARLIESTENCNVKIAYGGSGHIMKSVEVNQVGDIFFPGKDSYINTLIEKGIVRESSAVGYNQIGFFVSPGNPKQIDANLNSLLDAQLKVVIGSPNSGSVGREARKILKNAGIYQQVVDAALYLTTDSKGLSSAIKNQKADLVINWKAVSFFSENAGKMEFLPLPAECSKKRPLVMGLLSYSRYPQLARKLIQLAKSPTGQTIFRKYGFQD